MDAFGVRGRLLVAFAANSVGDDAQRDDETKACDDKDRFDFHKFAFIKVQLSLSHKSGLFHGRTVRKTTTKDKKHDERYVDAGDGQLSTFPSSAFLLYCMK